MSALLTQESVAQSPRLAEQQFDEQDPPASATPGKPRPPRGRRGALIAVAVLAALAGEIGSRYIGHTSAPDADNSRPHGADDRKAALGLADAAGGDGNNGAAARIETVPVEIVPRRGLIRLTGTLNADEVSSVAGNVNGIVSEVRVDRGSVVKKGQVLVQLDPTDAKNKLAEGLALVEELKAKLSWGDPSAGFDAEEQPDVKLAKATLALATAQKARAELLLPKQAISGDECERYQAEHQCAVERYRRALQQVRQDHQSYQTAVARLAALRKAVADTTIVAPFDGMVSEKNVAIGEQVTGGFVASKIVTMVRTNPLRLLLTVPQQEIGQIAPGQTVAFHVDSFPNRTFAGKVRYISPGVTNDTRALVVEAVVDNADGALRPGLFATAELEVPDRRMQMLVPIAATQRTGEVARVLVVREGTAREQVVALGEERDGKVEVRSGLTGKELLLAHPDLVRDGETVRR